MGTWSGIQSTLVVKEERWPCAPAATVKARQYLQGIRPWLAAGQRERWCPWPRQPCPPGPGDGPAVSRVITSKDRIVLHIVAITSSEQTCCVLFWTRAPRLWQFAQWWCPGFRWDSTWLLPQRIPRVCGWPPAWSCPGCCMSSGRLDSDMEEIQHGVSVVDLEQTHACL